MEITEADRAAAREILRDTGPTTSHGERRLVAMMAFIREERGGGADRRHH